MFKDVKIESTSRPHGYETSPLCYTDSLSGDGRFKTGSRPATLV